MFARNREENTLRGLANGVLLGLPSGADEVTELPLSVRGLATGLVIISSFFRTAIMKLYGYD